MNSNLIGFNTLSNDITNSKEVINTLFHETTNKHQHHSNEQSAINRGNTAGKIWELKNYRHSNNNILTTQEWLDKNKSSKVIDQGNEKFTNNLFNHTHNFGNADADVAFQITKDAAAGFGHMSGYFQDREKRWFKFDTYTTEENPSQSGLLSNMPYTPGISINYIPGNISTQLQNNPDVVYIKTSSEQDEKIVQKAIEMYKHPSNYHLLTNNCADSVIDLFYSGGIELPSKINPIPNSYFEKLQKAFKK